MKDKATIIVFSGDFDKVLAAFNIATGAASMGMEVVMFFTFWGLNVIKKDRPVSRAKGLMRGMLRLFNRGGVKSLPMPRLNLLGMGPWMMRKLMAEFDMPSLEEMIKLAKELGVRFIACTTTMGIMGVAKEDLIPEVDDYATKCMSRG